MIVDRKVHDDVFETRKQQAMVHRRDRNRAVLIGLAILTATGLTACREHGRLGDLTAASLQEPEKRHPVAFSKRTEALYVEVPSDGLGLSENQATDIFRFVDRYKSEAHGRLQISAPASVRGHLAISKSFREIEHLVDRAGVPDEAIERLRTRSADRYGPAVKLSYDRPLAMPPTCGSWPEDLGQVDRERVPYENFGCATQRNLALTVANARDLRVPQPETPRSSEVRSASWSKYSGGGGGAPAGGGAAGAAAKPGGSGGPAVAK